MADQNQPIFNMGRLAGGSAFEMSARQDYLSPDLDGQHLPVAVLEGANSGPTVCISAGLHGSEYCALETAQQLLRLDPTLLSGRLVVLPLVNIAAFAERSAYINPRDGLNLNRVFPGSAGGSSSQKIADWLTHDVYRHADCVLDLHSGDVGEYVSPFAIFLQNDPRSRELALASGLDFAIGVNSGGMSIDGAAASGVPGVILEAGGALARGGDVVDILYGGVLSALAAAGIIDDMGRVPSPSCVVHDPIANYAPHHGMWYPDNEVGVFLETNAVVGRIRDYFGHETAIIRTSEPGFLLYQLVGMPINEGEVLCWIGEN